jgi:hypothetical protein
MSLPAYCSGRGYVYSGMWVNGVAKPRMAVSDMKMESQIQ